MMTDEEARSLLAQATDMANTVAREWSVEQAANESGLPVLIERLRLRANERLARANGERLYAPAFYDGAVDEFERDLQRAETHLRDALRLVFVARDRIKQMRMLLEDYRIAKPKATMP